MSAVQPLPHAAHASLRGMATGLLAYTLFTLHDAIVKGLIDSLSVVQILFVRSVIIALLCLAAGRAPLLRRLVRSPNKPMLVLRAVLTLAAWCMYYPAGNQLQLAEMTTLYYFAPILTIVLAVIFLKEQLTLARVGAAAIGFFGIVVAANPAGLSIGVPALMVLGAALLWAFAMIVMRTVSKREDSLVLIVSMNLFYVLVLGVVVWLFWRPMTAEDLALALGLGVVGGSAQYALVEAARRVPASVLGTVEYSGLIWSFALGYLFWREQPTLGLVVGAVLVTCAGIWLAVGERRNRRHLVDAP
jgi:RarD protein